MLDKLLEERTFITEAFKHGGITRMGYKQTEALKRINELNKEIAKLINS